MESVPFELRDLPVAECALLFGVKPRTFREKIATLPGFPRPRSIEGGKPRWRAGEILKYRDEVGNAK